MLCYFHLADACGVVGFGLGGVVGEEQFAQDKEGQDAEGYHAYHNEDFGERGHIGAGHGPAVHAEYAARGT